MIPKGHVATRTASFDQTPDTVWNVITDFPSAPTWRSTVKSMERLDDRNGHPVWVEVGRTGRLTYEVTEFDPPRRMVTRIADDKLPFGGCWTYEISDAGLRCRLTITENGEIYNPVFRCLARFVFGYHATMERYLADLGGKFSEEIVTGPAGRAD